MVIELSQAIPEIYGLMGIVLFTATSLFTAVFDRYFHKGLPYLYQAIALAGLLQLAYNPLGNAEQIRALTNQCYLTISLINLIIIPIWLIRNRYSILDSAKMIKAYIGLLMIPAITIITLIYTGQIKPCLLPIPIMPMEVIPITIAASSTFLLTITFLTLKPNMMRLKFNKIFSRFVGFKSTRREVRVG
mgnify:CR=1 FL=1